MYKLFNYSVSFIFQHRKAILSILILTFMVYGKSLFNHFVEFDEDVLIFQNAMVRNFDIIEIFKLHPNFQDYIPLTFLSYAIEFKLFAKNPFGYHLTNTLFHLFNSLLVYFLMLEFSEKKLKLSLFVALIFAVHPLHVESVAWVAQRKDVLFSFFYLLGLIFYFKYLKSNKNRFMVLTTLCALFSLLSKLMGISFVASLFIIDLYSKRKLNSKVLFEKLPCLFISLMVLFFNFKVRSTLPRLQLTEYHFFENILKGLQSYSFYIYKTFWPTNLTAYYQLGLFKFTFAMKAFSITLLICLFTTIIFSRKFKTEMLFGLLFFLITLFPTLKIIPFGTNFVVADRFIYLPLMGLLISVGYMFLAIKENNNNLRPLYQISSIFIIVFLGLFSFLQTSIWKNHYTLWSNVLQHYPLCDNALTNLGVHHFRAKNIPLALQYFELSKKHYPYNIIRNINLTSIYLNQKNYKNALALAQDGVNRFPTYAPAFYIMGKVQFQLKNYQQAIVNYSHAVKLDPQLRDINFELGKSYLMTKNIEQSEIFLKKELTMNRQNAFAYNYLGLASYMKNDFKKSISYFKKALKINPDLQEAKLNLSHILKNP